MELIFKSVELLANSPIWLGICGFGLIIAPIIGIQLIHNNK